MPAKILVVDDEPHLEIVILQVFRKEIRAKELSFLFGRNGEEALRVLAENPDVDMVISDINMPEMGGLALLKNLNEQYPLLKTVIVTAYGDMANIRSAMNHGAFDFLNKPINFKDLKITISKTLDHVKQLKELHRERQQRYLAEKLKALTEHITTTLDPTEVLNRFLKNLGQVTHFTNAMVLLRDDTRLRVVATLGEEVPEGNVENIKIFDQALTKISHEQLPLVADEMDINLEDALTAVWQRPPRSLLCIPLISKHGVPGIVVLDRGSDMAFSTEEREAAFALSSNAASAIENARLFEDVRRLAITDSLTGIYNRRHFMEQAEIEVTRSLRYGNPLCAIMLDIDNFKGFNDNFGHPVGDRVLMQIASVLKQECRQTDLLGRYGGDEMAILLIETDLKLGEEIAERLRKAVEGQVIKLDGAEPVTMTISVGMATLGPNIQNLHSLLDHADRRLLEAKQAGRNRLVVG